jgi:hypothetical protein
MNQLAQWWVIDGDGENKPHKLVILADKDGLQIHLVGEEEIYVGIEVLDGALRGTFGPNAEVVSDDIGLIVEEAVPSVEGTD